MEKVPAGAGSSLRGVWMVRAGARGGVDCNVVLFRQRLHKGRTSPAHQIHDCFLFSWWKPGSTRHRRETKRGEKAFLH